MFSAFSDIIGRLDQIARKQKEVAPIIMQMQSMKHHASEMLTELEYIAAQLRQ